jgi:UDP-glucose 4-epimerase
VKDVDVVVHLAWNTVPKTSNEDPVFDVISNVCGTLTLCDACVKSNVKKVVFLSSGGTVYGAAATIPLDENQPPVPLNSYGITKLTAETYLGLYRHLYDLEYMVLRPSNPYGPLQNPLGQVGTVAVFLYRALQGIPIRIWGDGSAVRDYIFIDDLVEAITRAIQATNTKDRVFNVGSGTGLSLMQLVDRIALMTGHQLEFVFEPAREFDVPVNVLSNARARQQLGWQPVVPLEVGLEQTRRWMLEWIEQSAPAMECAGPISGKRSGNYRG